VARSTRSSSGRSASVESDPATTGVAQTSSPSVEIRKVEVPTYFASNVNVSKIANDANLMFARWVPTVRADGTPSSVAIAEPVVLIQMSLGTLKDLSLLVSDMVAQIERDSGQQIETDYTKQRAEVAASSGS
jgi:hypothetical protein